MKVKKEGRDVVLRVKQESTDVVSLFTTHDALYLDAPVPQNMSPESDSKPNTVLADTRQKHKDECLLREALQAVRLLRVSQGADDETYIVEMRRA